VMHQIPCADCQFFTHNMRLKCPVHPTEALSEQAIGCTDFYHADPTLAAQLKLK
jgi:RNA polymerase subunit RPABC4/transcription elongation factor Spt4